MPDIPVLTTTAPEVDTVGKHSPFGAMLSRTLPRYRGVFPVGVCDVELPVPHATFGNFTHKGMSDDHGSAGLSLDTVLYSIYYPTTDDTVSKKVIWFPKYVAPEISLFGLDFGHAKADRSTHCESSDAS